MTSVGLHGFDPTTSGLWGVIFFLPENTRGPDVVFIGINRQPSGWSPYNRHRGVTRDGAWRPRPSPLQAPLLLVTMLTSTRTARDFYTNISLHF